jgi:hypothetical protein
MFEILTHLNQTGMFIRNQRVYCLRGRISTIPTNQGYMPPKTWSLLASNRSTSHSSIHYPLYHRDQWPETTALLHPSTERWLRSLPREENSGSYSKFTSCKEKIDDSQQIERSGRLLKRQRHKEVEKILNVSLLQSLSLPFDNNSQVSTSQVCDEVDSEEIKSTSLTKSCLLNLNTG